MIADNRPAFSIYLIPGETTEHTIRVISEIGNIDEKEIQEKLQRAGKFQPVKIVRQLDIKKLTWIQENIIERGMVTLEAREHRQFTTFAFMALVPGCASPL